MWTGAAFAVVARRVVSLRHHRRVTSIRHNIPANEIAYRHHHVLLIAVESGILWMTPARTDWYHITIARRPHNAIIIQFININVIDN